MQIFLTLVLLRSSRSIVMYCDRPLFRTSFEELQEIDTRSEYIFWGHFSGVFRSVFLACATAAQPFAIAHWSTIADEISSIAPARPRRSEWRGRSSHRAAHPRASWL